MIKVKTPFLGLESCNTDTTLNFTTRRIWENFGILCIAVADEILMMGTVQVCRYKNLRVFNFAILLDSRKLSAHKKLVFYSNSSFLHPLTNS